MRGGIHYDLNVDSCINNVRISFRWRPWIDATLYKEMLHWANFHLDNAPDVILFGIQIFFN